jgi:hypothetical protein
MSSDIITGRTTGTAAAINITLGWIPARVDLMIGESGIKGYWDESMRSGTFVVEDCTELRTGEMLIGRHLPLIGSTDTQLANTRCVGYFDAAGATAIEIAAVAAGTAFTGTTHDVATASKWGLFLLSAQTGGTKTITPSAALNYATEAAAIAAIPTTPSNEIALGYITVQSTSGAIWDATTDSLAGGTTGTAANATNYYEGYGVMTNGITPTTLNNSSFRGFTIGTAAQLNILGSQIDYKAYRT